jgi:hypothetical protein
MEPWEETGSFMPVRPFLMLYFIDIGNEMRGHIVSALNGTLKGIKNCFRCDCESVVFHWHFFA